MWKGKGGKIPSWSHRVLKLRKKGKGMKSLESFCGFTITLLNMGYTSVILN
jgi:hypothetical protein